MKHSEALSSYSQIIGQTYAEWYNTFRTFYLTLFEDMMASGKEAIVRGLTPQIPQSLFNDIRQTIMQYKWNKGELLFVAAGYMDKFIYCMPSSGYITFAHRDFNTGRKLQVGAHRYTKHIIYTIDCFVYDFITGVNGMPLMDYLKFLYQFNDSVMILSELTAFACLSNSRYAPTGKKFMNMVNKGCTFEELIQEDTNVTDEPESAL